MSQFYYTTDAWGALGRKPADRSKALAALARKLGAKLISLHYTMGDGDGVALTEARDDKTAMAVHGQGDARGSEGGWGSRVLRAQGLIRMDRRSACYF